MPSNLPVQLTFAGLAANYCYTNANRFALDIVGAMAGFIAGNYNLFNYGNSTPAVNDRDKPWIHLDANGNYDRIYVYSGGVWRSEHPSAASGSERRMWVGTEAALWSYDGGDGNDPSTTAPTATTGAMWQVDHDFDARMPIGPGTLPSTTAVAVGGTGGAETVTLDALDIPKHKHLEAGIFSSELSGTYEDLQGSEVVTGIGTCVDNAGSKNNRLHPYTEYNDPSDTVTAHDNMPPYRGIFIIKRTARAAYTP